MIAIADRRAADWMYTNFHVWGTTVVSWCCHEHQWGTSCGDQGAQRRPRIHIPYEPTHAFLDVHWSSALQVESTAHTPG